MTVVTEQATVEVGDFFVCSWGYDQTNIDFYKVVGITPSGKSVKVQRWRSAVVSGRGGPQENVVPGSSPTTYTDWSSGDPVERDAPIRTHRLSKGGWSRPAFTVNSFSVAQLWDGKPEYRTGSGWGR